MRWRSKCTRELRLVQYAGNITLQASGVHSHQQETPHRLSVGTLTSIHEAVHHNVTQSTTEIRRTVSREETHLTVSILNSQTDVSCSHDADGSWSEAGPSVTSGGGGDEGSSSKVSLSM